MYGRGRSLILGLAAICSAVAWVLATDDASIPRVDATAGATERPVSLAGLPLAFEANRGQVDDAVEFLSRTGQSTLFLTRTEAVLSLPVRESRPDVKGGAAGSTRPTHAEPTKRAVLRMRLANANPDAFVVGEERLPGTANYFVGADPSQWQQGVPTFGKVRYQGVYPGIDVVFYGNPDELEYDIVVAPGADPSVVALDFEGAEGLEVDDSGDLHLDVHGAHIVQRAPVIDQAGRKVDGHYVLRGDHRVGIELGEYDPALALVIDPVLAYGTYLGGPGDEFGLGIIVDAEGRAYVTGYTFGGDFPLVDPIQSEYPDGPNLVFASRLSPDGRKLEYSTYLGGLTNEEGGFAENQVGHPDVDDAGNLYIPGKTTAVDFPVTADGYDTSYNGGCITGFDIWCGDGWLAVLDHTGSRLAYGTYIGGSGEEWLFAVDVRGRNLNQALVAMSGGTNSPDYPLTLNAFQTQPMGQSDAMITVLDLSRVTPRPHGPAARGKIVFSTLLAAGSWDFAHDLEWSGNYIATTGEYMTHQAIGHQWHPIATDEVQCVDDDSCPEDGTCLGAAPLVPEVTCGWNQDCPGDDPRCVDGACWSMGTCSGSGGVMWCGSDAGDPGTEGWTNPPGYGNNWDQRLTKTVAMPQNALVSFSASWDVEPDYDYLTLFAFHGEDFAELARFTGTSAGFETHAVDVPEVFWGEDVRLAFVVTSDGAWSDADSLYRSYGAAQIDWVQVADASADEFATSADGWESSEVADGYVPLPATQHYGPGGIGDGFIALFDPWAPTGGQSLRWNAIVGGSGFEWTLELATDPQANIYATAGTDSPDLPTTPGVLGPSRSGFADAYVIKLGPDGGLRYLTYVGGSDDDGALSVSVDRRGRAYITGGTWSTDFPVTADAIQPEHGGGGQDFFVAQLAPDASSLGFATYIGGSDWEDWGVNILGPEGDLYFLVGATWSDDMPTTPGAFASSRAGGGDAFVGRIDLPPP